MADFNIDKFNDLLTGFSSRAVGVNPKSVQATQAVSAVYETARVLQIPTEDARKFVAATVLVKGNEVGLVPDKTWNALPEEVRAIIKYGPEQLKVNQWIVNIKTFGTPVALGASIAVAIALGVNPVVWVVGAGGALVWYLNMLANDWNDVNHWGPQFQQQTALELYKIAEKQSKIGLSAGQEITPQDADEIYSAYKTIGVIGIKDPIAQMSLVFTKENVRRAFNDAFAYLIVSGAKITKATLLSTFHGWVIFQDKSAAAAAGAIGISVPTPGVTIPALRIFTGIISQGTLGETIPLSTREADLISSADELRQAAENNLASFLQFLPGRIIYEIKLMSRIILKDGTIRSGTPQKLITGYRKDGTPITRTITNRFAVANVYAWTARNVRSKIDTIILGPVDIIKFNPQQHALDGLANDLHLNLATTSLKEAQNVQAVAPAVSEAAPTPTTTPAPTAGVAPLPSPKPLFDIKKLRYTGGTSGGAVDMTQNFEYDGKSFSLTFPKDTWKGNMDREVENLLIQLGVVSDPAFTIFPLPGQASVIQPQPAEAVLPPAPTPTPVEIPAAALAAKCGSSTLYEWWTSTGELFPTVKERGEMYQEMGLGLASLYTGTAEQNTKFLMELKKVNKCPGF